MKIIPSNGSKQQKVEIVTVVNEYDIGKEHAKSHKQKHQLPKRPFLPPDKDHLEKDWNLSYESTSLKGQSYFSIHG